MTLVVARPYLTQRLVVVFDICSSTSVLEDLIRSENQRRWRDLIIEMKNMLGLESARRGFDVYKFIGDGWILLFPIKLSADALFLLLQRICLKYQNLYDKNIVPVLSTNIDIVGVTFGIDTGTLMRVKMNGRFEYIGRPLNVASRLQGAIKDKDKAPQGKVLMSRSAFAAVPHSTKQKYRATEVERSLRNIAGGGNYKAIKLNLFLAPVSASVARKGRRPGSKS